MSDTTPVIKYRYKLPGPNYTMATQSFGIEPYYTRGQDGRQIKAGKSIIRCKFFNNTISCGWAKEAADLIVDLLNSGHIYSGPKILTFNKPIDVRGYFND